MKSASKYDGFISYSHAADGKLAPMLQAGLQRLAKPWYQMRALRIFRDTSSLSASPALWESIESALRESRYFLFMASPAAAESVWVRKEITWWLTHRDPNQLLIVWTAGDLAWDNAANDFDWQRTTALPDLFAKRYAGEPLFVDLTWVNRSEQMSIRNLRFRGAVLDVAAPMHGRPKEDIDGEDVRQFRRTRRLARAAVAGLIVLLLATAAAAWQAMAQRDEALRQNRIALSRQLTVQSGAVLNDKPDIALLLAREAVMATERDDSGMLGRLGRFWGASEQPEPTTYEARTALAIALSHAGSAFKFVAMRGDPVEHVAFTADGSRLVISDRGEEIRIVDTSAWIVDSRNLPAEMSFFGELSRDGRRVALVDGNRKDRVHVYDLETGKAVGAPRDGHQDLPSLALSTDGKRLAASAADGSIKVWHAETSKPAARPIRIAGERLNVVALSGDGALLAASEDSDGDLSLWDVERGRLIGRGMPGSRGNPTGRFSADGRLFVASGRDGSNQIVVWDAAAAKPVKTLRDATSVDSLGLDAKARFVVAGGSDHSVSVWDLNEDYPSAQVHRLHKDRVVDVAFSPDGERFVTVSQAGEIIVWQTRRAALSTTLLNNMNAIAAIAYSVDGSILAAGAFKGTLHLFDARTLEPAEVPPLQANAGVVQSVAFSPDSRTLASGYRERQIHLWDVASGRSTGVIQGFEDAVVQIQFSPDGKLLAATTDGGKAVTLWDASSLASIGRLQKEGGESISDFAFSHNGEMLAAIDYDDRVTVWSVKDRRPVSGPVQLNHFDGESPGIEWSADDQKLLTTALEVRARSDGKLLSRNRTFGPFSVSLDGELVAVGFKNIELWNFEGSRWIGQTLPLLSDAWSMAFRPDGRHLAVGTSEGALIVWDIDLESWMTKACQIANRNLTGDEWSEFLGDIPYRQTCPMFPAP